MTNTEAAETKAEARCRLIDLGKWASGQYVVSSPALDSSDDAEIQSLPGTHRNVDDED